MNSDDVKFIDSAARRETAQVIMDAIREIAGSEEGAVRIWETPTDSEVRAIWATVTQHGAILASEFCWGDAGSTWARKIEA